MPAPCDAPCFSSSSSSSTSYLTDSLNVLMATEENAFACQESVEVHFRSKSFSESHHQWLNCNECVMSLSFAKFLPTVCRLRPCKLAPAFAIRIHRHFQRHHRSSSTPSLHSRHPPPYSTTPTNTAKSNISRPRTILLTGSCTD